LTKKANIASWFLLLTDLSLSRLQQVLRTLVRRY